MVAVSRRLPRSHVPSNRGEILRSPDLRIQRIRPDTNLFDVILGEDGWSLVYQVNELDGTTTWKSFVLDLGPDNALVLVPAWDSD